MPEPEAALSPAPTPNKSVWRKIWEWKYTGYVVGAVAILWCWGNPKEVTTEKIQWRDRTVTTTKYIESVQTKMKYVGAPGSTTVIDPDGTIHIYGPSTVDLSITRSVEGSSMTDSTHEGKKETVTMPAPSKFALGAGPVISLRHPVTESKLLVDGVYTFGHLLFFDTGVGGILEAPLGTFVPDYAGIKVVLSW